MVSALKAKECIILRHKIHFFAVFFLCICYLSAFAQDVLNFNQAIETAYQNNPELKAQIQKANAAKGSYIQSKLLLNPFVTIQSEDIGGSGAFKGFESAETTVSLTQPIPTGNKRYYLQKAMHADYKAAMSSIKRKKSEVYKKVGIAYVNALLAEQLLTIAQHQKEVNRELVHNLKKTQAAGASSPLDLSLAEMAFEKAIIKEEWAKREIKKTKVALARFLGKQYKFDNVKLIQKSLPRFTINSKEQINQSSYLLEKKSQLNSMRAKITSIKKDVWPTAQFRLGARHFSDDNENALVVSLYFELPMFNKNQGKIFSSEANYTKSLEELKATKLQLNQEIYNSYQDAEQSLFESIRLKNKVLPRAKNSLQLAIKGFDMGRYTFINLSQVMLFSFNQERAYQIALAKHYKSVVVIKAITMT